MRDRIRRLLQFTNNQNDTEDVCQQFWMHLWKVGPNYWNPKGVNLIAGQIAFKWIRKHKPFVPIIDRVDGESILRYPPFLRGRKNGRHLSRQSIIRYLPLRGLANESYPDPVLVSSELAPDVTKVVAALRKLPGEQRAVFSFRFQMESHEELTFREIGQRLGISTGQAICLFYWARKNLQTILGER